MLRIEGVSLAYNAERILEGADLEVKAGEFVSLIGPSGSGKTSILRAVTRLLAPQEGAVWLDVPDRDIGFLFQDDALLPWRTARQNVALGLRIRGTGRREAETTADEWLSLLGLGGFEDRYPRQLSGGQRKRVAIAQVLALRPKLLLMDEPFASLDAIVRARITQDLLDLVERERLTVLLVTHDLDEALSVSDEVHVLSQGPRARIISSREVPIPRPRDVRGARSHPAFAPLSRHLWADLSDANRPASLGEAA